MLTADIRLLSSCVEVRWRAFEAASDADGLGKGDFRPADGIPLLLFPLLLSLFCVYRVGAIRATEVKEKLRHPPKRMSATRVRIGSISKWGEMDVSLYAKVGLDMRSDR